MRDICSPARVSWLRTQTVAASTWRNTRIVLVVTGTIDDGAY
jgi:hypothetical protein